MGKAALVVDNKSHVVMREQGCRVDQQLHDDLLKAQLDGVG
jgi:hypothetical protein